MEPDGTPNAKWRRKDPALAKRAVARAKKMMNHALVRGYGNDAQRRSYLAQGMVEFFFEHTSLAPQMPSQPEAFAAFKREFDSYPSQDNEGYKPERGSFKAGFMSAYYWLAERMGK